MIEKTKETWLQQSVKEILTLSLRTISSLEILSEISLTPGG